MSDNATATEKTTTKVTRKPVSFDNVKRAYCKARGTTTDTQDGVNAMKGMRAFIRANRAALIKAGWKSLGTHEKGAPYGDVPPKVARMIVTRKIG